LALVARQLWKKNIASCIGTNEKSFLKKLSIDNEGSYFFDMV
jgi:hypothetical protein